jgi:hypothetical protein
MEKKHERDAKSRGKEYSYNESAEMGDGVVQTTQVEG